MELHESGIRNFAMMLAHQDLGVYPQSCNGVPRTEFGNGWNACLMAMLQKCGVFTARLGSLPANVVSLIENGDIYLAESNGLVTMSVSCSDVFAWGCADGEDISESEIPELERALTESPNHGVALWCARKRKMRPQPAMYEMFTDDERHLFDAAAEKMPEGGV